MTRITVSRAAEQSVQFGGADDSGKLAVEIDDDTVDVNVPLIVEDLTEPLKPDPVQMVDADGRPYQFDITLLDASRTLIAPPTDEEADGIRAADTTAAAPPATPAWLQLRPAAATPVPATVSLTGVVTLRWGTDGVARLSLTIGRKPLPMQFTIAVGGNVQLETLPGWTREVAKVLVLDETAGLNQQITSIGIVSATRGGDDVLDDVSVVKIEPVETPDVDTDITTADPSTSTSTSTTTTTTTADAAPADAEDRGALKLSPPLALPASRSTACCTVTFSLPPVAGKYEITVEFDGPQNIACQHPRRGQRPVPLGDPVSPHRCWTSDLGYRSPPRWVAAQAVSTARA